MSRQNRQKSKAKKTDHSQRMNRLKAQALAKVAGQAWNSNQRYKSIALLSEAVRRDPTNPDLLLSLAGAHGQQRFYAEAEKLLARVLELAPRKANIHRRVAETYALIDRPERAIECFRRALELNRDSTATVPTLLELAQFYERGHQLDEAQAVVEEALTREPGNPIGRMQQAMLFRRRGETTQAETVLRTMVAEEVIDWQIRGRAWFELGQLLDDAARYEDAFQAFVSAKQLLKPHAAPHIAQNERVLAKNEQLLSELNETYYTRWRELPEDDSPYRFAVLTSHPRSGTTLVEQVLDSHEQLISADEFDVFSQWVHQPILRKFHPDTPLLTILDHVPAAVRKEARATYWKQTEAIFNEPIGDRMLLDKNPGMMIMLPFINWTFPEMKTLIALRDPRDVVLSCFMQKVPLTPIGSNWLSLPRAAEYYARTMKTWLAIRPLLPPAPSRGGTEGGAWLEFRYEDVVRDLEGEARKILEFLGLPWDERVLKFYEHAREKLVRSPTYKDVTQPVYHKSIGRWQNYARHFEPILEKLQPFVKEFGYESD